MNVSDFEALPSKEQETIIAGLDGDAQRELRARVRMIRLNKALKKAEANLANSGYPKHKHERCKERIAEYKLSLKWLADYGVEVLSTATPIGTQIDVPLGKLGKSSAGASVTAGA